MTVGIAAIAQNNGDPYVIVSADRMVTVGRGGGIEYEDTESKIEPFLSNGRVCAVAVGAGPTTYIDEVLSNLRSYIQPDEVTTIREAVDYCLAASQYTLQETINNQVLAPLGFDLQDLQDNETIIPSEIQRSIAQRAKELREESTENVHILVAGIGDDGPGVYLVSGGDYVNYTDTGYGIVGSGGGSARLTFIRRRYDKSCSMREGVFTVLEAKSQSEERQGVGQRMDMALLQQDEIVRLDDEIGNLRQLLDDIQLAEKEAREKVIQDWDYSI